MNLIVVFYFNTIHGTLNILFTNSQLKTVQVSNKTLLQDILLHFPHGARFYLDSNEIPTKTLVTELFVHFENSFLTVTYNVTNSKHETSWCLNSFYSFMDPFQMEMDSYTRLTQRIPNFSDIIPKEIQKKFNFVDDLFRKEINEFPQMNVMNLIQSVSTTSLFERVEYFTGFTKFTHIYYVEDNNAICYCIGTKQWNCIGWRYKTKSCKIFYIQELESDGHGRRRDRTIRRPIRLIRDLSGSTLDLTTTNEILHLNQLPLQKRDPTPLIDIVLEFIKNGYAMIVLKGTIYHLCKDTSLLEIFLACWPGMRITTDI
jgi:hypothetical protein